MPTGPRGRSGAAVGPAVVVECGWNGGRQRRRLPGWWRPVGLGILEHFEPGPGPARARPAHEPYWTGVGRDLEARENFFWPKPGPKCCF
jgi:hypothetical protein